MDIDTCSQNKRIRRYAHTDSGYPHGLGRANHHNRGQDITIETLQADSSADPLNALIHAEELLLRHGNYKSFKQLSEDLNTLIDNAL